MTPATAQSPRRAAGHPTGRPGAAVVIEFRPREIEPPAGAIRREIEPAGAIRRAAAPAARPRTVVVDGYVRASPSSQWSAGLASIDRARITRWAASRGWRVGCMFEEDSSTSPASSHTVLGDALDRVESRESDGLVVARFKHLGPSPKEALAALERISAAGGNFVSITDGIDFGAPAGHTIRVLLLSVLEW